MEEGEGKGALHTDLFPQYIVVSMICDRTAVRVKDSHLSDKLQFEAELILEKAVAL